MCMLYADDYTFFVVVLSPLDRVAVSKTMIRDLNRVSDWCDQRIAGVTFEE